MCSVVIVAVCVLMELIILALFVVIFPVKAAENSRCVNLDLSGPKIPSAVQSPAKLSMVQIKFHVGCRTRAPFSGVSPPE